MSRAAAVLLIFPFFLTVAFAEPPTNRLSRESSPYLLQHADNPVDWYPWGPEAFEKAKKDGKLIFLSIGYSSCHWCHVMEKESFRSKEVAKILNDHYVCIKVDREERPDVDQIYQTALQTQGQNGGWPLSMFLTADGKPIVGGTYWPPEDKEVEGPDGAKSTVQGFKSILKVVHQYAEDHPKELAETANKVASATEAALANRGFALVELDRDLVAGAVDELKDQFDKVHGGFGSSRREWRGPKFPMPPSLRLLQEEATRTRSAELDGMVQRTLDHMAQGGIYDHLGGGFHRYSTERTWTVPHFEKMLYDNAQLVEIYAQAYATTKKPAYKKVVQETLSFVDRELTSPDGAFYSALDADAAGEEGRFHVWTTKEIDEVLGDGEDAKLFKKIYGADGAANFEEKYHILLLSRPLAEWAKELNQTEAQLEGRLTPLRKKLFDVRERRARPFRDTKVLTSWNGEMIAAYAVAGRLLEEPKYTDKAARAANFLLQNLRTKDGRLLRTYGAAPGRKAEARLNGYLDDYAYLVHGLLCLHDATGDKKWLDEAKALTELMVKFHLDDRRGGFFYTSSDHEKLFARAKDQHDGAQPSGNSVAALNLVRLAKKTGEERYRELAEKSFKAFAGDLKENASSMCTLAEALAGYLDK